MASQSYTNTPKARLIFDGATLYLDPLDNESKVAMAAFFDAHGDHTTVAITEEDANRDGYGVTGTAGYVVLKLVTS